MIAIIGAGGKTTTMYALADAGVKRGKRVICTTSTHIRYPQDRPFLDTSEMTAAEFEKKLQAFFSVSGGGCLVAGNGSSREETGPGINKVSSPPEDFFALMEKHADTVIAEADGSKMLPLKVPRLHEPNLPRETKRVVVVAGLSSLNRPAREVCFRLSLAEELFGWEKDHIIAEEDILRILTDERAGLKGTEGLPKLILLNQADTPSLRAAGEKIRTGILEHFSRMPAEDVQVWITSRENREALFSGEGMEAVW